MLEVLSRVRTRPGRVADQVGREHRPERLGQRDDMWPPVRRPDRGGSDPEARVVLDLAPKPLSSRGDRRTSETRIQYDGIVEITQR